MTFLSHRKSENFKISVGNGKLFCLVRKNITEMRANYVIPIEGATRTNQLIHTTIIVSSLTQQHVHGKIKDRSSYSSEKETKQCTAAATNLKVFIIYCIKVILIYGESFSPYFFLKENCLMILFRWITFTVYLPFSRWLMFR